MILNYFCLFVLIIICLLEYLKFEVKFELYE